MRNERWILAGLAGLSLFLSGARGEVAPPTDEAAQALLAGMDRGRAHVGDYRAEAHLLEKTRSRGERAWDLIVHRRGADRSLMMLFSAPKEDAGRGYLRIDRNLFYYDPSVGRWERRTERERILGSNSRRADFDESHLAEGYKARYVAEESLGRFKVHHLQLTARDDADVAFPSAHVWIDVDSGNLLKLQEHAASGRLIRTTYYPKWDIRHSEAKGGDVHIPVEIRIFDEVETGRETTIVVRKVDLSPLDPNMFTKAWFEAQSR